MVVRCEEDLGTIITVVRDKRRKVRRPCGSWYRKWKKIE